MIFQHSSPAGWNDGQHTSWTSETLQYSKPSRNNQKLEKIEKYNRWKHIKVSSMRVCSYKQVMWLSQHFFYTLNNVYVGHMTRRQVQVHDAED